jgi:hypothetical protein
MDLTKLFVSALVGESIWETTKLIWQHGKLNTDRIGALVVGIIVALMTRLNIFEMMGLEISLPILGEILTGVLISRGANFMHDILGSIGSIYTKNKGLK